MNIPIISPEYIGQYTYDYILIASSFDEEITHQIIKELHICEEKILHMYNIYIFMHNYWKKNYDLSKKKILYISDENEYRQIKDVFKNRFNIIGCVDIKNLKLVTEYKYDYILLDNLMMISSRKELSKGKIDLEKNIIDTLNKEFNISINKVLCKSVYQCYREVDIKIETEGEENPDKKFLIINVGVRMGLCGCLSIIANNVRYAKERGFIPIVDMMTYHNQYLYNDEIRKINAWDKFFFQPSNYNLEVAMKSKNVFWSAVVRHDKINQSNIFNFLKMKPELLKSCKSFEKTINGKKLLGVLFRGTDYVNLKPYDHPIQPTLSELITVIKDKLIEWGGEKNKFDGIYICTEVEGAIKILEEKLNVPIYNYPQKRFSENTDKYLANIEFSRDNDKYLRGVEYFSAIYILSKCNSLVAGKCSGTTVALKLNNGMYENKYLFNLGRYGIDDIDNVE